METSNLKTGYTQRLRVQHGNYFTLDTTDDRLGYSQAKCTVCETE